MTNRELAGMIALESDTDRLKAAANTLGLEDTGSAEHIRARILRHLQARTAADAGFGSAPAIMAYPPAPPAAHPVAPTPASPVSSAPAAAVPVAATPAAAAPATAVVPEETWDCSNCHTINPAKNKACDECGTPKAESAVPSGGWVCKFDGFINRDTAKRCGECRRLKAVALANEEERRQLEDRPRENWFIRNVWNFGQPGSNR